MSYEIIAFLVGLGIIAFLRFGKGSLSGLTKLLPSSSDEKSGEKSGFSSFKSFKTALIENTPGKDLESKRWWWYTVLVVVAITLVYVTPETYKDYRFAVGGWFILLGLHLIVWPLFTEKTSLIAKVTMTAFIIFFTNAAVFPKTAVYEVERFNNWRKTFDNDYGKAPASKSVEKSAIVPAVYQPETRRNVITVTDKEFTEIPVPPGAVASFDCPYGAEARYYFTVGGGPLQQQDHDCANGPVDIAGLGPVGHFRIAFTAKTEAPQDVRYKVTF